MSVAEVELIVPVSSGDTTAERTKEGDGLEHVPTWVVCLGPADTGGAVQQFSIVNCN